ncbi:MTRF1L release factor glutamine methyltransferase-like isoform X2 [Physella acuta]|nr:MTRF1L release factor glutamine methyltransferase-like isoform X2 [Physella acuta]
MAYALGEKTLYNVEKQIILTKAQIERINRLCQLRLSGMPVQYVIGEWDFCDITLKMKAPVLIPRPETEELANLCIDSLKHKENLESGKILEIGCGTGAITLTLLNTFKNINAVSVDVSSVACELTKENADIIGVSDRLNVIEGDFTCEKVLEELATHGPFDLIVSNPPYLRTEDINNLQTEVRCFEDHHALDGGSDGMNLIKHILLKSTDLLHNKGDLWLEVDPAHPQLITEFIKQSVICKSLVLDNVVKDMFGKDRFCHLQRD